MYIYVWLLHVMHPVIDPAKKGWLCLAYTYFHYNKSVIRLRNCACFKFHLAASSIFFLSI